MVKGLRRFFRRRHPVSVVHYIGRKNLERIYDAKLAKRSQLQAQ